jgi:hypothetical protein
MNILKSIYNFLTEIGRIRAARHLAHRGDYEGARRVMMSEFKGWI